MYVSEVELVSGGEGHEVLLARGVVDLRRRMVEVQVKESGEGQVRG